MKYESKSSVVDLALSESRRTRISLARGTYASCAVAVLSGNPRLANSSSIPAVARATKSSTEFVIGVEHGFEGYLLKDMTSLSDKVLAARVDYRQGRATGAEIWRRRAEGYKS